MRGCGFEPASEEMFDDVAAATSSHFRDRLVAAIEHSEHIRFHTRENLQEKFVRLISKMPMPALLTRMSRPPTP